MANKTEIIKSKALELLEKEPDGIRYSELVRRISDELPEMIVNTIHGTVWNLDSRIPSKVYKPSKGVFKLIKFRTNDEESSDLPIGDVLKIKEEDFYAPFADWIVNELEECTKAIPLGGKFFKDKWGTPDVIGIREARRSDIIKPPTEIVSVEIKLDTNDLITAFGQSCSYKIFSHRSHLVIPKSSSEDDISRLDALSRIFGIGMIVFDNSNPKSPNFEIRNRSSKNEPDMFYVNKYLSLIEDRLF